MITGHFGLAAGAKRADHTAPLWLLVVATMWLDIVFLPLLLAGVETIDTPKGGGYGSATIHADYTHSLVGALLLSGLIGGFAAWRWSRELGLLVGAVAFSHWLLDLVVHRPDMPLLPGNAGDLPLMGFGLWRVPAVSILVELGILLAGVYLYWRTAEQHGGTSPSPRTVSLLLLGFGIVVLLLDALGF
jgi:membrane-bound metal-dependent hydrolase YbcI (DUF457 family)